MSFVWQVRVNRFWDSWIDGVNRRQVRTGPDTTCRRAFSCTMPRLSAARGGPRLDRSPIEAIGWLPLSRLPVRMCEVLVLAARPPQSKPLRMPNLSLYRAKFVRIRRESNVPLPRWLNGGSLGLPFALRRGPHGVFRGLPSQVSLG